jgi:hypothetical protein
MCRICDAPGGFAQPRKFDNDRQHTSDGVRFVDFEALKKNGADFVKIALVFQGLTPTRPRWRDCNSPPTFMGESPYHFDSLLPAQQSKKPRFVTVTTQNVTQNVTNDP